MIICGCLETDCVRLTGYLTGAHPVRIDHLEMAPIFLGDRAERFALKIGVGLEVSEAGRAFLASWLFEV